MFMEPGLPAVTKIPVAGAWDPALGRSCTVCAGQQLSYYTTLIWWITRGLCFFNGLRSFQFQCCNLFAGDLVTDLNQCDRHRGSPPLTALLQVVAPTKMTKREVTNRQITFKDYIVGPPKECDFVLKTSTLSLHLEEGSQDVLVKNMYLSVDPYQRSRMKDYRSSHKAPFASPLSPGSVIDTYGVGQVIVSTHPDFKEGDLVVGLTGWEEYSIVRGAILLTKISFTDIPLSYYVGVLGLTGFTAYAGFYNICSPKKGDQVFVSAASGAVGHLVGQFAKLEGCYVIGSTGSNQKVDLLKNKLGFHNAFNYKEEPDLKTALKRYFPSGIDIYFENVGGDMLEAVIENMKDHGRIALCGVISQYNKDEPKGVSDLLQLVYKRIKIQGFLAADYLNAFPEFVQKARDYLKDGTIQCIEDISEGIESIPSAFVELFEGKNVGKKIVHAHGV